MTLNRDKHILLVDDNKTIRDYYKRLFRFARVHTETAKTLKKAVHLFRLHSPLLVITDLQLTTNGFEGFQLIELIKTEKPSTPIVLITAHGDDIIREKAMELGVDYYFEKPVHIDNLITILKKISVAHNRQYAMPAQKNMAIAFTTPDTQSPLLKDLAS